MLSGLNSNIHKKYITIGRAL